VIAVTRLNGSEIVVNTDLIETVEATPDTVLTLVDGKKYVVHETPAEVIERIRHFRVSILRRLDEQEEVASPGAPIYVMHTADEEKA